MNTEELRKLFPQLNESVYGKKLVYLDNAASSLRPISVIDKWKDLSIHKNSNLHRAVHHTADLATEEFENTRDYLARKFNVSREEIIFTSGATAAINLVAYSFGEAFIERGDEIIVTEAEHHSNIVPWQLLCQRKGAILKVLGVDEGGRLEIEKLPELLTNKTKLLAVSHISNVLGLINPIKEIVNICHSASCAVLVDGAQGIVHDSGAIKDLGFDFYVFSGHKVFAAPGTGVLIGRKKYLELMPPYMGGGEMIASVNWSTTTYAPLPFKFEAGTQNFTAIPTLVPALELADKMEENPGLVPYLTKELQNIEGLHLVGTGDNKIPLFSFYVEQAHHEDLALILDKMGIALRSGQMCAEPLMDRFSVTGMLRASFAPYNTMQEAEYFVNSLRKAIKMLQ